MTREEKDIALGVKPLGEAVCDECPELAFTRWYADHGTRRESVAHTLCYEHNVAMLQENAANRKRLGLDTVGRIMKNKTHWAPGHAISWPSGGARRPNVRTFMPSGNSPVCMSASDDFTDGRDAVTCKRCLRIMGIARRDTDRVIREVLSRGQETTETER